MTRSLFLAALAVVGTSTAAAHVVERADGAAVAAAAGPRRLALEKRAFSGPASWYETQTGNAGACGGSLSDSGWTIALNAQQWDGGSHCGQSVTITYNGNSQTATVADECMGCGYGGIDLTPGLFAAFADQGKGIIQVSWVFGNGDTPKPSSTWTPPSTSTTPQWTPPSTTWKPPTSTWKPPTTTSQWKAPTTTTSTPAWTPSSSSTRSSSSTSTSSAAPSSSAPSVSASSSLNSTAAVNSTLSSTTASYNLTTTTIALGNGTSTTATLAVGSGSTSTLTAPLASGTQVPVTGAIGSVNQVVLQMANIVVSAADSNSP